MMKHEIINTLIELTYRSNDDVKTSAILALGDYQATVDQQQAILRLLELCKDTNKEVVVSAITALSKLALFMQNTDLL